MSNTADSIPLSAQSLELAEDFARPTEPVREARDSSLVVGADTASPGVCAALTFLAKAVDAKAVVEIGTGTGLTGLALFTGMNENGILTSIDSEADWQLEARQAFTAAGIKPSRFRLIAGVSLEVLPRLQDAAYDIVFVNGDKLEYVEYVAQALRLLRRGGVVIVNDALWGNLVADPRNEDDETVIIREALQAIQDDETLYPVLIPLGDGLAAAVKG